MYDEDTSTVTAALQGSNPTVFSDDTISKILALTTGTTDTTVTFHQATPDANGNVTVPGGTEVTYITTSDTAQTKVIPPANTPVLVFQGKGGVDVTLGATTVQGGQAEAQGATDPNQAQRVVIGTEGNDKFVINDARNTSLTLGTGNSTVVTGKGVDTVVAGLGNATISGGTGDYAVVELGGKAEDYTVTKTANGHAVVTDKNTGKVTDITKIQYVEVADAAPGDHDALIFAKTSKEASLATMYEVAFGRTADAAGLDYWFDLARDGATLKQIADAFTKTAEFGSRAQLSNADFVQSLYQNSFHRAGEAEGTAYWLDLLGKGVSRAEIIRSFAEIHTANLEGVGHEVTLVGNVTIISNII